MRTPSGARWLAGRSHRPVHERVAKAGHRCACRSGLLPRHGARRATPVLAADYSRDYSRSPGNRTHVRCRRGDTNPKYTRPVGHLAHRRMTTIMRPTTPGITPDVVRTGTVIVKFALRCARMRRRRVSSSRRSGTRARSSPSESSGTLHDRPLKRESRWPDERVAGSMRCPPGDARCLPGSSNMPEFTGVSHVELTCVTSIAAPRGTS
jgi:hypothetical protein